MPPKKSNPKKKAPKRFVPEFSSDDEIPEIEEEEEEGSEDIHPDDACQPDNTDEKAGDSKTKQRDIPGGSRPSPSPSTAKSTKLTKERADKELVKSPVPYWSDPKYWIPVLGIIQMHVSLEDINFFFEFLIQTDFQLCVMLKVGMATNNQLTGYLIGKYVNGYKKFHNHKNFSYNDHFFLLRKITCSYPIASRQNPSCQNQTAVKTRPP